MAEENRNSMSVSAAGSHRLAQFYEVAPDAVFLISMVTLLDQVSWMLELQPLR